MGNLHITRTGCNAINLLASVCNLFQLGHGRSAADCQPCSGGLCLDYSQDIPSLAETILGQQRYSYYHLFRAIWKSKWPFHQRRLLCHVLVLALVHKLAEDQHQQKQRPDLIQLQDRSLLLSHRLHRVDSRLLVHWLFKIPAWRPCYQLDILRIFAWILELTDVHLFPWPESLETSRHAQNETAFVR